MITTETKDAIIPHQVLKGKQALVVGIANEHSIAYGCARAFHELGAELAVTYLNDKAKPYVEPLAQELEAQVFMPLNVSTAGEVEAVFERIKQHWGAIDILVHSIAFAPKKDLEGGLLECSAEGFAQAMDISTHSFIRMARLAAPMMPEGGCMFAMTYYGALATPYASELLEKHSISMVAPTSLSKQSIDAGFHAMA